MDDAIAEAVSEYSRLRQRRQSDNETDRMGAFAHEMRNHLSSATLAYEALKGGRVGIGGSTAGIVDRNLRGLRDPVDGALAEVRIESGKQNWERVLVSDLLDVQDECGGLPVCDPEELFAPYAQKGANKTGLGLGLSISRKGIEALRGPGFLRLGRH